MKKILLFSLIFFLSHTVISAKSPYSHELKKKKVVAVCNAVADWQIANHNKVKHHNLDWTNGALYKGIAEWAKIGKQPQYYDFLINIGMKHQWAAHKLVYHADDICVGQMYIDLFKLDNDKSKITPTLERALFVANNPSTAPLMKTHKKGAVERWSWCDALFMAPPVYAALYTITGNKELLDYLTNEYRTCTDSLYDKTDKLFYRDNIRIPLREPNGQKQFWSRGCGWVFAGLPLVIENLPADEPSRQYYIDLFVDMAQGVIRTQDKEGSWHASLLDPKSYPMPENSASAFFCYGLAWGVRNGYLPAKPYKKAAIKAWKSLVKYVDQDGKLGYIQPVGADPRAVKKESTDVYGVGAFLLAGAEMWQISR